MRLRAAGVKPSQASRWEPNSDGSFNEVQLSQAPIYSVRLEFLCAHLFRALGVLRRPDAGGKLHQFHRGAMVLLPLSAGNPIPAGSYELAWC